MMDHRGTGHGTILKCEKAVNPDPSQVPACAKELEAKYGDLAAFSTTSAAMDVTTFISEHGNDYSTTLYGLGYGTMLVERIMHLDPPQVTGYVLDAVATTSGASLDQFLFMTDTDANFGEVGDAFMAMCTEDPECNAHFKKKGLKASVLQLMANLDKNPKSDCAQVVKMLKTHQEAEPPSFALRILFGRLLMYSRARTLLPPIVHRLLRCEEQDAMVLMQAVTVINFDLDSDDNPDEYTSPMLDNLIMMSEMWESPTPSGKELRARYQDTLMTGYLAYQNVPKYCAFSKEKSPTCNKLNVSNYKGKGIIYERDEYWNKATKIPKQASVLLISSEMDPLMPSKFAEALLKALRGNKKELVTLKYGARGSLGISPSVAGYCGVDIVGSFVKGDGDLSKLNKTCIDDEAWNVTIPSNYKGLFFGTDEPYDGAYNLSTTNELLGTFGLSLSAPGSDDASGESYKSESEDESMTDPMSEDESGESTSDSMSEDESGESMPDSASEDESASDFESGSAQQE
ncbi:Serine protease [Phytophthora cinnamomi]|uniref:Serine protease n=1 Tax=Phytophthora cinnamomi TaxID=4785 RepID=UPI00355A46FC|nr:Serine protease [Phytophthora cinnamomi]